MKRLLLLFAMALPLPAQAQEKPVVVSIKPLHSLVAAVMEGDDNAPLLLVDGRTSLHHFSLKPSQMRALNDAAIVFYMGDSLETFVPQALSSLPVSVTRVPMEPLAGLIRYPVRAAGDFGPEGGDPNEREASAYDLHLWMMPLNARTMVMEIARQLAIAFPGKRRLYYDNARRLAQKIKLLDTRLDRRMSVLRGKPFIVFHDAFQYFEKSFGVHAAGAVTRQPGQASGARHVGDIRTRIKELGAVCVFREPQFESRVVENLVEGTGARLGVLDPEGALLDPGPDLYFQLMEGIASSLEKCLAQDGDATRTPNGA